MSGQGDEHRVRVPPADPASESCWLCKGYGQVQDVEDGGYRNICNACDGTGMISTNRGDPPEE